MNKNIILATDSYKLNHWNQYPSDTEAVYSYFESRPGAKFPYTVFFGLQYLLKEYLVGHAVKWDNLPEAARLANLHFGNSSYFNYRGWQHIMEKHGGRLPLRIKAVPEGTVVPVGNVMMTVENTCPECFWLTNAVESLLTHVWYPSTVATLSHQINGMLRIALDKTADNLDALPFMDHDFGYRGASSHESAAMGGAAHLISSMGTDTLPAIQLLRDYYGAEESVGLSVVATEHSVMTALGEEGEFAVVQTLLDQYPTGILSVVADSYDYYRFVRTLCEDPFKSRIKTREGVFVVRPDSVTKDHSRPHELVVWTLQRLWNHFGGRVNSRNFKVLDPHVRVLWGDGLTMEDEQDIILATAGHGFSVENLVFGMGGGRLQKLNRDTQRFAFKCSAIKRDGEWHDVWKKPLDESKASKKGRLALLRDQDGEFYTAPELPFDAKDDLALVFENGELVKEYTFDEVRANARAYFETPTLA